MLCLIGKGVWQFKQFTVLHYFNVHIIINLFGIAVYTFLFISTKPIIACVVSVKNKIHLELYQLWATKYILIIALIKILSYQNIMKLITFYFI